MDFVLIACIKPDLRKTLKINFSGYEITSSLNYNIRFFKSRYFHKIMLAQDVSFWYLYQSKINS